MKTPHKHKELINAWADGAEIEGLNSLGEWVQIWVTTWSEVDEFRIKPEQEPVAPANGPVPKFNPNNHEDALL